MRKIVILFLCVLCAGLLHSCGKAAQPVETAAGGIADEAISLPAELSAITADVTMDNADVTCETLERNGSVIGFNMRFLQSDKLDALFSDQKNMYFGVVKCGKKTIGVPMEQVRVLTDSETHEFVITLLLPSGERLFGRSCEVSFYTAKRDAQTGSALFCANKEILLP